MYANSSKTVILLLSLFLIFFESRAISVIGTINVRDFLNFTFQGEYTDIIKGVATAECGSQFDVIYNDVNCVGQLEGMDLWNKTLISLDGCLIKEDQWYGIVSWEILDPGYSIFLINMSGVCDLAFTIDFPITTLPETTLITETTPETTLFNTTLPQTTIPSNKTTTICVSEIEWNALKDSVSDMLTYFWVLVVLGMVTIVMVIVGIIILKKYPTTQTIVLRSPTQKHDDSEIEI
jgi:hypothetical protein